MSYNLLEERWIPVLWADGKVSRVGTKEAFTQAARIRQIAASNPTERLAILRSLQALLYWCKGNPPADTAVSSGGSFSLDWFPKLDANRECFDLLGDGKRSYQYRKEGDKSLPVDYLVHEIPTGTNLRHFRHASGKMNGLCPACCATSLLRLPAWRVSFGPIALAQHSPTRRADGTKHVRCQT